MTVTNEFDKPQFITTQFSVNEDETLISELKANYSFGSVAITEAPSKGIINIEPNGKFEFKPAQDLNGLDTLKIAYVVNGKKYSTQLQIAITPVNDAPKAKDFVIGRNGDLDFNEEVVVSVAQFAVDVDGDALTISSINSTS